MVDLTGVVSINQDREIYETGCKAMFLPSLSVSKTLYLFSSSSELFLLWTGDVMLIHLLTSC